MSKVPQKSNHFHRVKLALIFKTIGEVGSRLLGFAFVMLMARKLGPQAWGHWYVALAVIAYMGFFLDPGFSTVLTAELAKKKRLTKTNKLLIRGVFTFRLATFAACLAGLVGAIFSGMYAGSLNSGGFLLAAFLFTSSNLFIDFFHHYQDGLHRHDIGARYRLAWRLSLLAGASIAFLSPLSPQSSVLVFAGMSWVPVIWGFIKFKLALLNPQSAFKALKPHSQKAFLIGTNFILAITYLRVDVIMLEWFSEHSFVDLDSTTIGYYAAAMRFVEIAAVFPTLIMTATFPTFNLIDGKTAPKSDLGIISDIFKLVLFVGIGIQAITVLGTDWIIAALLGKSFAQAKPLFLLISPTLFIQGAFAYFTYTFMAQNQFSNITKVTAVGAIFNVLLNAALISSYGVEGCAIATCLTGLLMLILAAKVSPYPHATTAPLVLAAGVSTLLFLSATDFLEVNESIRIVFAAAVLITVAVFTLSALLRIKNKNPS